MGLIVMIGCGRMGGAMASQWRRQHEVVALTTGASQLPEGVQSISEHDLPGLQDPLAVVLAVKPQTFPGLVPSLAPLRRQDPLFISVMAGLRLDVLASQLDRSKRLVRAMPNSAAAIARSMTVATARSDLSGKDRTTAIRLLLEIGHCEWLDDETLIDAATAVSGSGPAYFFRFAEALVSAGVNAGLSPQLAQTLARSTLSGAGALAAEPDASLSELREEVTSAGGTTAAGLAELVRDHSIDCLCQRVVDAAMARSRALAAGEK
ncbi:MAG: pyrroline-5-carboxylate reductase [Novosphingobium sp.]|nr:pyrroline-5-carboxylate reductase [Novosphingobium sp.]